MPTYQYACTEPSCGHRFELVQSFTDPAASQCPVCSGGVRKVYGSVGVVFKGSGFYRTDSRNSAGSGGDGKAGAKAGGSSESGSGSEKKPAAKSESSTPAASSSGGSSNATKAAAN